MSNATFTVTPIGITKTVSDNSTYASTTAFVKTFISTYLIRLVDTVTIASTVTFNTIYISVLRGVTSLTLRGNLSIGKASGTVSLLGNTINIDANYPALLSCPNSVGSKIQAGSRFIGGGTQAIVTPIVPNLSTSFAFASAGMDASIGSTPVNSTGFNIRNGNSITGNAYWIMFH